MLSLPDFKEKQVLFVRAERGASCRLNFENDNLVFTKDDTVINRASAHKVFAGFIMGDLSITTGLMREGRSHGVSFFFLKHNFEAYAAINSATEGHYVLRQRQYEVTAERELAMSRMIINNKLQNQCSLLTEKSIGGGLAKDQQEIAAAISRTNNQDSLRGLEGNAARRFFEEYFAPLPWFRRMPRAKEDVPNLLLDIGYSMLFNITDSLLRLLGFDTYKGFYHKLFFQRRSLACDLVEPLRCIIDRQLVKAHNLKQIDSHDFKFINGRYQLPYRHSAKYAELFLTAIMERKEEIYAFLHQFYRHILNDDGVVDFPTFIINK